MRRILSGMAVLVGLTALALVTVSASPTRASGDAAGSIMSLLHASTPAFPAVAMTVDGQPVSGSYINEEVTMIEYLAQQRGQTLSRHDAIQEAIDNAERRDLFILAAQRRGITASDQEAAAWVDQQVQNVAAQGDPNVLLADVLQADGDASIAQYEADPKVLADARDAVLIEKLLNVLHAQQPPVNLDSYLGQLRASATVTIHFSY